VLCFLASSNPKNRLLRHFYPKQKISHFSPFRERENKSSRFQEREEKKGKKKLSFFFCGVLKIEMVEVKIQLETSL
jgi:hypothetical protein